MKILKNIKKIFMSIIVTLMIIGSTTNVYAQADTIQLGQATKTGSYIANVDFSYKRTTSGQFLYCLNMHKNTAENTKAVLVKNSKYVNGGLIYILKNGYPYKSITGDSDKDYYITQTAVWWYLDRTSGSTNLGEQFKKNGSDNYGLRKYVQKLVDEGYNHRNDSTALPDTKLVISAINDANMTLNNNYYVSNNIKATTITNIGSYTVTLSNQPAGTKIVKSDNTEFAYNGAFTVNATDSFKVKVPQQSITKTELAIKVTATGTGIGYIAGEYQPTNSNMQNVALLEKVERKVTSETTLHIDSSKVTIVKIDANTEKALPGAVLVLKDSNGKEITRWTSTNNGHVIRNLPEGTYTVEEEKAPEGYLLNKAATKFTINNTNKEIKVLVKNAPKKVVVTITKVDQETNNPLAGAELLVKDSNGNEVIRFTTTEEAKVLTDLKDGTYTIEEITAPQGYIRSSEVVSFTIDDNHISHQITFVNAKEVYVPDTASNSSAAMIILGIAITCIGISFIYKNGKKAK